MSPETIANLCIDVAADYFAVTRAQLLSRARPAWLCWPRHVAMILAYDITGLSTTQVAAIFNRRNHVTILHAYWTVRERLNLEERRQLEAVRTLVNAKSKKAA
jgi:chromosomal replication initiator protein